MLMRVTWVSYDTNDVELYVKLAGRDASGNRRVLTVKNVNPFVFVPSDEDMSVEAQRYVLQKESGYTSFDGKSLDKIVMHHPSNTKHVIEDYSVSYESDIPFYRRCALMGLSGYITFPGHKNVVDISEINTDPVITQTIEPRVMIGDIETLVDNRVNFDTFKERANQPIISFTLWDSQTEKTWALVVDPEEEVNNHLIAARLNEHWPDQYEEYRSGIEVVQCDDECDMLNEFLNIIENNRPDVIGGWNWVNFDHEYLLKRMHKLEGVDANRLSDCGYTRQIEFGADGPIGVERMAMGLPGFDMMDAYCKAMSFHRWRSQALNYVSSEVLGVGKVEGIKINEAYHENRSKLLAYNIIDTQLCVALDKQEKIFNFFFEMADICSIPIYDAMVPMRRVDGYMLSRRGKDEILPTQDEKEIEQNAGGMVFPPPFGIFDWVGVHDLKSLYPSVIITFNLSPETIVEDISYADLVVPWMPEPDSLGEDQLVTAKDIKWSGPNVAGATLKKEGIIPKYLRMLFPIRDEKKAERDKFDKGSVEYVVYDLQQTAYKVLMNTFYGLTSNNYWRLSHPKLGDMVTTGGRYVIWSGSQISDEMGYPVMYSDTDSIFVRIGRKGEELKRDEYVQRGYDIAEELNRNMDKVADSIGIGNHHPFLKDESLHGNDRHCFQFEFEKVYRRYLQAGKKKRYAGRIVWKEGKDTDETDIVGFEMRRSDISEVGGEMQAEILSLILDGKGFDEVSKVVQGAMEEIQKDFRVKRHGIPTAYNPPYKVDNLPVIRGVGYAKEYLGANWNAGDKPFLVYVYEVPDGQLNTDVIALDWTDTVPEDYIIDDQKMIEKTFEQPMKNVLSVTDWTFDQLVTGLRATSLYDEIEDEEWNVVRVKREHVDTPTLEDW